LIVGIAYNPCTDIKPDVELDSVSCRLTDLDQRTLYLKQSRSKYHIAMLTREYIRADQSFQALKWNAEYGKLDQAVKDLLILYRQNLEKESEAGEIERQGLMRQAGEFRTKLLQHMTEDGLHNMHNCKGVIDDIEQLEDSAKWSEVGCIPGRLVEPSLTRGETPGVEANHADGHSSAETEYTGSVRVSSDGRSVETTISQNSIQGMSTFSRFLSFFTSKRP
jgi:hypothetical protein